MAGYSVTFSVVDQATKQIEAINKRIEQMRAPMERQARAVQKFVDLSGLGKIADGFKNIARTALDAFSSMIRIVPVLGALTSAASIAGIAKLVETWGQFGLTLQRTADEIGTTPQTLQQLQDLARLAGGSVDNMTESLKELTQSLGDAATGNAQTYAWFKKFGIDVIDPLTGKLRVTADVLPQVLQALDNIPGSFDRMKAAVGLGGKALFDLTETLRLAKQPGESLADTYKRLNAEAAKYTELTADQIAAQQRYKQAIGALETSFDHLQQQIGTTLATALTPFINQLAEFVRTHEPQITAAINRLITGFADWIKGIDWDKVEGGIKDVGDALVWLTTHLDTVKDVAEGIAALFAVKWAVGIATSIAQVITALGSVGAISAGAGITGVGLLGTLGAVVGVLLLIEETWRHWPDLINAAKESWETLKSLPGVVGKNLEDWRAGRPTNPPPAAPSGPAGPPRPSGEATPFYGGVGRIAPGAGPTTFSGDKAEFLKKAWPLAQQVAAQTGLDPRVVLAQAATESGWGAHAPGQNYFGIGGAGNLRSYGSMEESFQAYGDLINKRYPQARAGKTPEEQVAGLVAGGYTPDKGYADTLNSIIKTLPDQNVPTPANQNVPSQASLQANFAARTGAFGTPEEAGKNLTTVTAPNGAKWQVNKDAADQFQGFINDVYKEYPGLQSGGGYNPRKIRGGTGWSAHAWGTAIDLNPETNPLGSTSTDLPADVGDLASKWGLKWGGTFEGRKDPMHFEIGELRKDVAALNPKAEGAPMQVTGGPPVSGSVDVTVTHRNPPPGVTVAAKGAGDVNVAPPRIEQQQLAAA
jgi:hypothetical protein